MAETGENKHINIKHLDSALRNLRDVNSSSEDYMDVLDCLDYKKSPLISSAKFDAILIKTAKITLRGIRAEFILMSLGLLLGYERDIDIGTRRLNYLQHSNYTLEFVKKYKGLYNEATPEQQKYYMDSLLKAEEYYIDKLAVFLQKKIEKGKFDEFIKDLKDYYDSDTDTSILPEPEYIKKKIQEPPRDDSKTNDSDPHIEPTFLPDEPRKSDDTGKTKDTQSFYMRLMTIALFFIAGILAFALIIKPWWTEKANAYKEVMSSVPPAENPSLAEDIPVIEAMLIEAESFKVKDIDEENRIDVVPDITKKLTIELEPQDADMSTLKFESSSPKMVNAEYGYITAYSKEMEVGKSYVVDITITAIKTDYKEVIHVTVESSETPDDVDGAVFGGSQK